MVLWKKDSAEILTAGNMMVKPDSRLRKHVTKFSGSFFQQILDKYDIFKSIAPLNLGSSPFNSELHNYLQSNSIILKFGMLDLLIILHE